jgi:SAM-dependent methyltransferase
MAAIIKYSRKELLALCGNKSKVSIDLGCGARKQSGFIGVDIAQLGQVDIVTDLDNGLPFEDNSVDEVYSNFFFEHTKDIIFLFKELFRVSTNGAVIKFSVPYYQSGTQFKDPTHRSVITPDMLQYFSDDKWYGSDYGIGVNFKLINIDYNYLPPYQKFNSKKIFFLWPITKPLLRFCRRSLWNVVHSMWITLEVKK